MLYKDFKADGFRVRMPPMKYAADVVIYKIRDKAVAETARGEVIAESEDHAEVIQAAIDVITTEYGNGGKIVIAPGEYNLSRSIEIRTKSGLALMGAGSSLFGRLGATRLIFDVSKVSYGLRVIGSWKVLVSDMDIRATDSYNEAVGISIEYGESPGDPSPTTSNFITIKRTQLFGFGIGIKTLWCGSAKYLLHIEDAYVKDGHSSNLPGGHGWSVWLEGAAGVLIESSHIEDIYVKEDDSPPAPTVTAGSVLDVTVRDCRIEREAPLPSYATVNEAIRFETIHGDRKFVFDGVHFEGYNTDWGGNVAGIIYIEKGAYPKVRLRWTTVYGTDNLVVLKRPETSFLGIVFEEISDGQNVVNNTYFEVWSGETGIDYKIIPMTDWYKYFLDKRIVKLSGDGTTTEFNIEHTLWTRSGLPPKYAVVIPQSKDASSSPFAVIPGTTRITISYQTAPPSGTDNLVYLVIVKRDTTLEKG